MSPSKFIKFTSVLTFVLVFLPRGRRRRWPWPKPRVFWRGTPIRPMTRTPQPCLHTPWLCCAAPMPRWPCTASTTWPSRKVVPYQTASVRHCTFPLFMVWRPGLQMFPQVTRKRLMCRVGALRDNEDDARLDVLKSRNILHICAVTSLHECKPLEELRRWSPLLLFPFYLSHWVSFRHFLSFPSTSCGVVAELFAATFSVNDPTCFHISVFHPWRMSCSA